MSDSIFGAQGIRVSTVWDGPLEAAKPRPTVREQSSAKDPAFIAIIEAPLELGETALVGWAKKEAELRAAFAALTVMEARSLQSRLSNPRSGDQLGAAFMRMTYERRARLISFLADARRRDALKGSR